MSNNHIGSKIKFFRSKIYNFKPSSALEQKEKKETNET